jgi:hypothetical protein
MRITLLLAAIIIPFFVLRIGIDANWPFALITGIFPLSFIFAIAYLYQRAALKDLLAAVPPEKLRVPFELIAARVPKMHVFVGAAIVVGGILMIWGSRWPVKFIPILVTAGFTTLFFGCFHKERAILSNRAVAVGRVIERTLSGGGHRGLSGRGHRVWMITYTFKDMLGNDIRSTAQDNSSIYEPGMNVPVLYDRSRSDRNLPITGFMVYKFVQPSDAA